MGVTDILGKIKNPIIFLGSTPLGVKEEAERPLDSEKLAKNWEKEEKLGRFFLFALLTDRAGYATGWNPVFYWFKKNNTDKDAQCKL